MNNTARERIRRSFVLADKGKREGFASTTRRSVCLGYLGQHLTKQGTGFEHARRMHHQMWTCMLRLRCMRARVCTKMNTECITRHAHTNLHKTIRRIRRVKLRVRLPPRAPLYPKIWVAQQNLGAPLPGTGHQDVAPGASTHPILSQNLGGAAEPRGLLAGDWAPRRRSGCLHAPHFIRKFGWRSRT